MTDNRYSTATKQLIDAAFRHADGITSQLAKPDWKPGRAHLEQARNSIRKLADMLDAAQAAAKPCAEGARLSNWLAEYSHDLAEDGDLDQEAAEIDRAAQWIANHLTALAESRSEPIGPQASASRRSKELIGEAGIASSPQDDTALSSTQSGGPAK
ncbi:hypothetical protein JQ600_35680 [Bradyrhizobium sp. AUGA SZCCT0176]|uniref:hypothetical protein n=1 Tax=Bradyrhizobium sp. AUGA SZCCT0176 TaxID=2807664 RepID=UPI001BAA1D94|nr:hypothetical protein [Bradyrhizobium sp. AUGA SZCCT0176]MBR1230239.1 hypothetical protein [Bradyrhizobium sp. AUGA SZCCT0176]